MVYFGIIMYIFAAVSAIYAFQWLEREIVLQTQLLITNIGEVSGRIDLLQEELHALQARVEESDKETDRRIEMLKEGLITTRAVADQAVEDSSKFHRAAEQITKISKYPRLLRKGARLDV